VVVLVAVGALVGPGEPSPAGIGPGADVLRGAELFVDPESAAAQAADDARNEYPGTAALLDKVARGATADWFGGERPQTVRDRVAARVAEVRDAGAVPVLVAYNIPGRDCGSHSAGGAAQADGYRAWVDAFAGGIGYGPAAVIVEPDALAQLSCLDADAALERAALLRYAVEVLTARSEVAVYLDASHANWIPESTMADRLTAAGVAQARGFALNVSFFGRTGDELAYGRRISEQLGGAHFVIDTSRNGRGPAADREWCNPPGRALGGLPDTSPPDPLVDAYLWIKHPGYSDGTCNGGPPAGRWWTQYARGLAERADW
jgi:endoglucanase